MSEMDRSSAGVDGPDVVARLGMREYVGLAIVLLIAIATRVVGLNAGLWYDEVVTVVEYVRPSVWDTVTNYTSLNNHILYSLLAKASVTAFGESAWAVRLPAFLFGVAGVATLWILASSCLTRLESWFCALLLAISYHHVWFSQNARGYTGLIFLTLVATMLFSAGVRRPSAKVWGAYALVFAFSMYIHLTAVFLIITHAMIYAGLFVRARLLPSKAETKIPWPRPGYTPFIGFLAGGFATLALYAVLIPDMIQVFGAVTESTSAPKAVTEWKNPLWTIMETLRAFGLGGVRGLAVIPAGLICVAGMWSLMRRAPVLVLTAVIHPTFTLVCLVVASFRIWPRYFLLDIGFVLIIAVHGAFVIGHFAARTLFGKAPDKGHSSRDGAPWSLGDSFAVIGFLGMVGVSLVLLPRNYQHPKQDLQGAVAYVESSRGPGDQVCGLGLAAIPFEQYYAEHWGQIETVADLSKLRRAAPTTWVVYSFPSHTRNHFPELMKVLSQYEPARKLKGTLGEGDVYVYRLPPLP